MRPINLHDINIQIQSNQNRRRLTFFPIGTSALYQYMAFIRDQKAPFALATTEKIDDDVW